MSLNRFIFILATVVALPLGSNAADKVGVIGAANQHITATDANAQKRDMSIGKDIFFKDTISTDKTGNAQLLFVDKSALTVGANSSVVIDEFVYNPATSSGNMVMNGTKGTFRFIGGALSKKDAVKIKTPVGTIGIRGGIAIVNVNPDTGATNATFVYGHQMTFENAAGQITSTTSSGTGFSLNSPTDIPKVIQFTQAQIDTQMNALEAKEGTNAGAKQVPTENDVKGGLVIEKKAGDPAAPGTDPNNKGGQNNNGPTNKDGTPAKPNGQATGGTNNNGGTATAANPNGAAPAGNGHYTADGGYMDSSGKYYTAKEVAEYHAAHIDEGGRISDKDQASGNYVTTATSPNGGAAPAGGTYNPATGTYTAAGAPAAGGTYNPATGTYTAAGTYNNGAVGGGTAAGGAYGGGYAGGTNYYGAPATGGAYNAAPYAGGAGYNGYVAPTVGNPGYVAGGYNNYGGYANYGGYSGYGSGYYGGAAAPYGSTYYAGYTGGGYYNPANTTTNIFNPYPPTNTYVDPYATYGASTVDSMATVLYNEAYNKVISAGGTSAQALAAAVVAQQYFRDHLQTGTEFNAAVTATRVNTDTYMVANFPGWTPSSGTSTTSYNAPVKLADVLQADYNNAKAVGQAAYLADRNNGYDHQHAMGAGNAAYNNALTSYMQSNENNKAGVSTAQFTTAGESINVSTPISSSLLTTQKTLAAATALGTQMNVAKTSGGCGSVDCSYVNWGYWGHIQPNNSTAQMNEIYEQVVPYVYGTMTNPANIPGSVGVPMNVTYTGNSLLTTSGYGTEMGTISADITLSGANSATLTKFDFTVPSQSATLNFTGSQAMGATASFTNVGVNGNGFSGNVSGALFGPTAQGIGGNMTYTNGAVNGAGVYIGGR